MHSAYHNSLEAGLRIQDIRTYPLTAPIAPDIQKIEADQDRRPRRASRSHHHLPSGRDSRHRPDGPRHPRRDPPPSSASVMRMTAIHAQTERIRQDRSARRAEKHHRQARSWRLRALIPTVPAARPATETAQGGKMLVQRPDSGDLHVSCNATWGMSVDLANRHPVLRPATAQAQSPGPDASTLYGRAGSGEDVGIAAWHSVTALGRSAS